MKRIQSKAGLLKRRVGEVHSRAKLVGIIYLFATIALLAAAAILPIVSGTAFYEDGKMPVLEAYDGLRELLNLGFGTIFQTPAYIIVLLQLVLYFVLLLVLFINVIRALCKLNWLFKRRASYINGFNRNMYAMDALGKRFSSSFSALVIFNVLFIMLTIRGVGFASPALTVMGYIVLGVSLLIRCAVGAMEGSVPLFTTGGKIIEQKRDHGLLIYFIRNFVQVVVLAGVLYFLLPASGFANGLHNMLTQIIVEKDKMYLININTLPVYVELLAFICLTVMIKHATASTEYNRKCNHGLGMKNFAVFSCALTIMFVALIVFPYVGIGVNVTAELNMPILWAAIIAFVGFLFDCICRARDEKRIEEETDEDPVPGEEESKGEEKENFPYGLPIQPQMPYPSYPYAMAVDSTDGKQPQYQPIFVPVFCAFPQNMAMPAPAVVPAPAPQNLLPAPSPATAAAEEEEMERTVEDFEMNPHRKYKVYCPQCGKALMAKDVSPYHRCPACDKVFQLRKFKTYVKSE